MQTLKLQSWETPPVGFTGIIEFTSGNKAWYKRGNYHREDGPAFEYLNGPKYWYKNGDLHREDGPAIEYSDGTKHWYKQGKWHREDGPAIEMSNGDQQWWIEGKLHREDGPAIEYSNGYKEWWLDGKELSEILWKNRMAVLNESRLQVLKLKRGQEHPENFTGIIEYPDGEKRWFKEGKLHREDGPAIEYPNGDKEWRKDGNRHREDGPAVEYIDGDKYWYKNGKLHREDGPAGEYTDGRKYWFKEGNLHREDGPAVELENGSKFWYKEGKRHREDGPACEYSNGSKEWSLDNEKLSATMWKNRMAVLNESRLQVLKLEKGQSIPENFTGIVITLDGTKRWFKEGKNHRENGHAIELSDGSKFWFLNGKCHREGGPALEYSNGEKHWYKEGKFHREDGPAREYPNGYKEWRKNGKLHRTDGPAIENTNGQKSWFKDGKQHREDGPAVEHSNGYKEWYKEGILHREDGPAVEFPEGVCRWAINGVFLSEKEWRIKVGDLAHNSVPENSKFVETIKSDAKEVAVRIASQQIVSTSKILITKLLKQKGKTESTITKFLNSNYGNAVTGAVAGVLLKGLASRFDGKYSRIINEISDELRVSSEVLIIDELATHVLDASEGLFNQLTTTKDLVRVAVEETEESFENPESISVDAAEKNQKSILSVA